MAIQNTSRSYLGVAKETTEGTIVAPTFFIPVSPSKLKASDEITRYTTTAYAVRS